LEKDGRESGSERVKARESGRVKKRRKGREER